MGSVDFTHWGKSLHIAFGTLVRGIGYEGQNQEIALREVDGEVEGVWRWVRLISFMGAIPCLSLLGILML